MTETRTQPKTQASIVHDGHVWTVTGDTMTSLLLRRPRVPANPTLGYVYETLPKGPVFEAHNDNRMSAHH